MGIQIWKWFRRGRQVFLIELMSQKQTHFIITSVYLAKMTISPLESLGRDLLQYIPNSIKSRSIHWKWRPKSTRLSICGGEWNIPVGGPSITARKANNTVVGVYLIFSPSFRSLSSKERKCQFWLKLLPSKVSRTNKNAYRGGDTFLANYQKEVVGYECNGHRHITDLCRELKNVHVYSYLQIFISVFAVVGCVLFRKNIKYIWPQIIPALLAISSSSVYLAIFYKG